MIRRRWPAGGRGGQLIRRLWPALALIGADIGLAEPLVAAPTTAMYAAETMPVPVSPNEPGAAVAPAGSVAPARLEPVPVRRHEAGDPLEGFNRTMFGIFTLADRLLLRPAALGYRHVVPKLVRGGLRHFFSNLREPIVFINDLLQLRPGRALRTAARFAFNSTIGIGGLVDVAREPKLGLPHRDNGFGDTLGYYGVGPGPYLFLPFVGPSSIRDFIGGQGEGFVLPLTVGTPFDRFQYQVPRTVVTALDERSAADSDMKALLGGAVDPYATLRSAYLQGRAGQIAALHGAPRSNEADPALIDPAAPAADDHHAAPAGPIAEPPLDPLTDPAAPPPGRSP